MHGVCLLRALLVPVLLASALSWAQKPDAGVPAVNSAVPPPESTAARVQACTACHGREGRATPDGYFPRLAGKPQGYLYHQLLNFREGRRRYPLMSGLLEHLSDAYLAEMVARIDEDSLAEGFLSSRAPAAALVELTGFTRSTD